MPLSNLPVFKQCRGTGPSRDQAAGECQPRFSIVRWSLADDSRLRGSAHDPERPSEVVAERGCPWADSVHPGNPRIERLNNRYRRAGRIASVACRVVFCNTSNEFGRESETAIRAWCLESTEDEFVLASCAVEIPGGSPSGAGFCGRFHIQIWMLAL